LRTPAPFAGHVNEPGGRAAGVLQYTCRGGKAKGTLGGEGTAGFTKNVSRGVRAQGRCCGSFFGQSPPLISFHAKWQSPFRSMEQNGTMERNQPTLPPRTRKV